MDTCAATTTGGWECKLNSDQIREITTPKKPPRINWETLKAHLKSEAAAAADNIRPVVKTVVWLPRTVPMTFRIVFLLCIVHGVAGLEGDIEGIRERWRQDPGKPLSWFTYAFLHTDNPRLGN